MAQTASSAEQDTTFGMQSTQDIVAKMGAPVHCRRSRISP
jgi:hypothetical protein